DPSHQITAMLREWGGGDREALEKLMPLVYNELHKQAARYLRRERPNHTLQTTALIHEAYVKLVDQREANWESRNHFFAIAAQAMRRILIDYARARRQEKRGGDNVTLALDDAALIITDERDIDLLALDQALNRLAKIDEQQVRIVELRYFSGLSLDETAEAIGISRATVAREWSVAKSWLRRELTR
ncbi:MAG: sigma-70 family RNA polymerase sigma factor, partial [Acidobacteriota bacterium]